MRRHRRGAAGQDARRVAVRDAAASACNSNGDFPVLWGERGHEWGPSQKQHPEHCRVQHTAARAADKDLTKGCFSFTATTLTQMTSRQLPPTSIWHCRSVNSSTFQQMLHSSLLFRSHPPSLPTTHPSVLSLSLHSTPFVSCVVVVVVAVLDERRMQCAVTTSLRFFFPHPIIFSAFFFCARL